MDRKSQRSMPMLIIILSGMLTACAGSPNVGRVAVANCPQPPLIPTSLRSLPPEAQIDYSKMLDSALALLAETAIN